MRTPQPPIPAAALARQARLKAALQAMDGAGPSLEPACLQQLCAAIIDGSAREVEPWAVAIQAADLVEEAFDFLRTLRRNLGDKPFIQALASRLTPLVLKAQQRRAALWQLDTRRTLIRATYAKETGCIGFDDGDIHALFLQAFRLEGLRLALDLGKRPRPLLSIALPLPVGVGGREESLDVVLKQEPTDEPNKLMARLNLRLPEGLRIHQWIPLPVYASDLGDLAWSSHWRWEPSTELRIQLELKVSNFLQVGEWPWERGAAKSETPLNLRAIVTDMHWEGGALCFATRMGVFQALNPLKLLGAILGMDSGDIRGLVRTGVDLKPDARVGQAERFEPKLKNMYEDAVLLGGSSNIVLVDEDEDEPIRLGPPSEAN